MVHHPEWPVFEPCVAVSSFGIPAAPLNGAENPALVDVVKECHGVGGFHEHAIGKWALGNILPRLATGLHRSSVAVFAPAKVDGNNFCLLGFPRNNARHKKKATAEGVAKALSDIANARLSFEKINQRLTGIELYTKEVGHDFAGSIQAVLAKLTYIEMGSLNEAGVKRKAQEATAEVRNAYAVAESLGVAVDNDYRVSNPSQFSLADLLAEITREYEAEAKEKNIVLRLGAVRTALRVYGDRLPFKLAIANLVKNAIKYSHPDTDVDLSVRVESDRVVILVQNKGIGLPLGEDRKKIWDFGFRCTRAKRLNVNGSGIGLHSCRKVIVAHGGQAWVEDRRNGETTFFASVPNNRVR